MNERDRLELEATEDHKAEQLELGEDAAWVAELEAQMNKDRQGERDAAILTLLDDDMTKRRKEYCASLRRKGIRC
jgi:hypothetical protein